MSTPALAPVPAKGLAPVAEDMSAYIIAGAVRSERREERETDERTPAEGVEDGAEAERLGYRRVWLSERWDIKQADVILSAVAARTTRLGVGTGSIQPTTRHPLMIASMGATLQSCFGPRFVLMFGRGDQAYNRGLGVTMPSIAIQNDYVDIVRRLWAGEAVRYDGPVGKFEALQMAETFHGEPPPIWYASFGNPLAAKAIAANYDGVMFPPMFSPEASGAAIGRIRQACERLGRDPAEIRFCQPVVTAPAMEERETRSIAHGRAVTYLQYPRYGDALADANGWDHAVLEKLRNHPFWSNHSVIGDRLFHRHEMLEVARVIPDAWMEETCAIGSVEECVRSLQRWRDAGVDEIATYGSTPGQNAKLIAAWRGRPEAKS